MFNAFGRSGKFDSLGINFYTALLWMLNIFLRSIHFLARVQSDLADLSDLLVFKNSSGEHLITPTLGLKTWIDGLLVLLVHFNVFLRFIPSATSTDLPGSQHGSGSS